LTWFEAVVTGGPGVTNECGAGRSWTYKTASGEERTVSRRALYNAF
jgi:hypothetical protein